MKRLLLALLVGSCSAALLADTLALKKNHPDTYVVKKGDTLWDISGTFLEQPWYWPKIWDINPQVKDPHWIYPGDTLSLVYVMENGEQQPRLTITERAPIKIDASAEGVALGGAKLTPKIRSKAIESAIPAIPLEKISAFLSNSRVVDFETLNSAPYIIAGEGKHIVSGAGDKVFARGDLTNKDNVFGVFRSGVTYKDPETKEILGIQAIDIGAVRVIALDGDVTTLAVNETNQEIRINDRLLPSEEKKVVSMFYPKAPNQDIKGEIIGVEGGVSQVGSLDIIAINVGTRDELEVGDVLGVAQTGEIVRDRVENELVRLPDVEAGLAIVFRTFEKMSFALVVTATRPIRLGDRVVNP